MPWSNEATIRRAGMRQAACGTLVVLAGMALASCGAGPGAAHPDLVVEDPAVSDRSPAAGKPFTFSATVRNAGRGTAAATTLRVYRSDDATISTVDDEVGDVTVAELAASASRVASVTVEAGSGTSYYGACVEPVAGESDTANNCSTAKQVTVTEVQDTVPASPRPDLVVVDPAVSDHLPAAGASLTFSATVRNAGGGNAAATMLRVYRSDDEAVTSSDEQVGEVAVPELAALQGSAESVELSAPSTSGPYYYRACVHAVAAESDTANNCSAQVKVTVQDPQVPVSRSPRPELEVNLLSVCPSSPPIGGLFKVAGEVRKPEGTPIAPTTLRFYLSMDATITQSDTELSSWRLSRFATGAKITRIVRYEFLKAPSSKGTYYYGACVDAVAGSPATKHNCSAAVKVDVSDNKPDLQVTDWDEDRSRPTGRRSSVQVAVWNDGSPSDATTLRLYLLPDPTSTPTADKQVGETAVPELVVTRPVAATSVRHVEFQAPATAGKYHYVVCVDSVPRESDTTNNCSATVAVEFHEV
ncbi:MAG: hypothetical protein OXP69_18685 [Spirochaetaceae bacterium]|nr:hypothetical protein [Spirochaetaceae bacterium]